MWLLNVVALAVELRAQHSKPINVYKRARKTVFGSLFGGDCVSDVRSTSTFEQAVSAQILIPV
jgi:hypothetical protein|tara:strand:+ start:300 stop:488 length:189 start_codon:yes stop_codon:yes gene_type:complete